MIRKKLTTFQARLGELVPKGTRRPTADNSGVGMNGIKTMLNFDPDTDRGPTLVNLLKVCEELGTPLGYLLGEISSTQHPVAACVDDPLVSLATATAPLYDENAVSVHFETESGMVRFLLTYDDAVVFYRKFGNSLSQLENDSPSSTSHTQSK